MTASDSPEMGRACKVCGKFKSWENYDKKKDGMNGFHSRCKECISRQKRNWWKKKNMKKRTRPSVLDFHSTDIFEKTIAIGSHENSEFEKILRQLVVDTMIKGRNS
jgi:hypothetical protein